MGSDCGMDCVAVCGNNSEAGGHERSHQAYIFLPLASPLAEKDGWRGGRSFGGKPPVARHGMAMVDEGGRSHSVELDLTLSRGQRSVCRVCAGGFPDACFRPSGYCVVAADGKSYTGWQRHQRMAFHYILRRSCRRSVYDACRGSNVAYIDILYLPCGRCCGHPGVVA